jgi:hypothetical protein
MACTLVAASPAVAAPPPEADAATPAPASPPASPDAATPPATTPTAADLTVSCSSKVGERNQCPADTSKGVALMRSSGKAPCLLGKSWGYDDQGIWVSDGCSGLFVVGHELPPDALKAAKKQKSPAYVPNQGFLLYEGENGQIYMRLMTYVRYLNQKGLDPTYTDSFGTVKTVVQRQDIQLNKFFLPFSGWFMTPKMRYYLYVWSANTSQGDPAQVVGAGSLSYNFNRFVTLGGGISALPSVRSTEGQFPYWLGVDNRLTADEFFRGSYTTGVWLKGELATKLKYMAMIGNNLSQLGVSASQLDNNLNTTAYMLAWLPTTGEFGLYGTYGDYDWHEKVATRFGVHYTHSREDKQTQPGTDSIENSQIRLTDGNIIFTPNLFGAGITVEKVTYAMSSVDAGIKYKGFSAEAEYYWRWLSNFAGTATDSIDDIDDHGYQVQFSAMLVPKALQGYLSGSEIRGVYGNGSEVRAGVNWYPFKKRGVRMNTQWIHLKNCPVGYTAVPYPVGGNGDVYTLDFEMNF